LNASFPITNYLKMYALPAKSGINGCLLSKDKPNG